MPTSLAQQAVTSVTASCFGLLLLHNSFRQTCRGKPRQAGEFKR
jgi:hypothetical protein